MPFLDSIAQERVESVGGTLGIESSPGMGTSILIRIPIGASGGADPHGSDLASPNKRSHRGRLTL
jgi:hypothetical protein